MFFVIVDAHSKWPELYEMSSITAQKTVDVLRHVFATFCLPQQLVLDDGPQFVAAEISEFWVKNRVRHIRCNTYHPVSNGLAERFVRSFKQPMKASGATTRSVPNLLENSLLRYCTTPHSTTGCTPASLFMKTELRVRLELLKPNCESCVLDGQSTQVQTHGQNSRLRELFLGQKVMARNYGTGEK